MENPWPFFAERAIQLANAAWDEKGWTDEDVDRVLQTKKGMAV